MNRLQAERELSWYYNVALVKLDLSAVDYEAVTAARPGWEYRDPNITVATRAKPIRNALRQLPPMTRKILRLAFTDHAWKTDPDHTGKSPRYELLDVYGHRLASLVRHYRPSGSTAKRREWALAALRVAVAGLCEVYRAV